LRERAQSEHSVPLLACIAMGVTTEEEEEKEEEEKRKTWW